MPCRERIISCCTPKFFYWDLNNKNSLNMQHQFEFTTPHSVPRYTTTEEHYRMPRSSFLTVAITLYNYPLYKATKQFGRQHPFHEQLLLPCTICSHFHVQYMWPGQKKCHNQTQPIIGGTAFSDCTRKGQGSLHGEHIPDDTQRLPGFQLSERTPAWSSLEK